MELNYLEMEISEQELNALIEDEKQASINYKRLGLDRLSRDEAGHHNYLLNLRKRWYNC